MKKNRKRNKKQGRENRALFYPCFLISFSVTCSRELSRARAGAQAKQSNQKRRPPTRLATPDSTEPFLISF